MPVPETHKDRHRSEQNKPSTDRDEANNGSVSPVVTSPSLQERIHKYCEDVRERGGTPPAFDRLRRRRHTMPELDTADSSLPLSKADTHFCDALPSSPLAKSSTHSMPEVKPRSILVRPRSGSSPDLSEIIDQHERITLPIVVEGEESKSSRSRARTIPMAHSNYSRKVSTLSTRGIEIHVGNGTGAGDEDEDADAASDQMTSEQLEIQHLKEENRLLQKQLQALHAGRALFSLPTEGGPSHGYASRSLRRRKLSKAAVLDLMREVGTMDKPQTYTQVFKKFLLSEGQYLNNLLILTNYFVQPFKLLVAYKPEVLSFNTYQSLFLNCEELVRFHKMFHSSLSVLKDVQDEEELVWRFLHILESNMPYITVYGPFLASQQPMRKKLFQELMKNKDFSAIVSYQEQAREKSLKDLLDLPYTRLQSYIDTLQLTEAVPMKTTTAQERFNKLILFLSKQEEVLRGEPGEWAEMKRKLNHVLEKLTADSVVPVEVFDPQTLLKKSGQLEVKENGKVVPKQCFLFSRHFAIATVEKLPNQLLSFRIDNPGFVSLCGAKVYSTVDVDGHEVQDDYETGRPVDREAFLIKLPHGRSCILKAAKPATWVSLFQESIKEAEQCCNCQANRESLITPNFEGNLAAASEEKLLARLTNLKGDLTNYLRVFFVTYPVFTTPKAVLCALAAAVTHGQEEEPSLIHPISPHIGTHLHHKACPSCPFYNCFESDNSESDSQCAELKSPRFSPPWNHTIHSDSAQNHLTPKGLARNLSRISERSGSSLSGEGSEMFDETPLVTPRESTVYMDMDSQKGQKQHDDESLYTVDEVATPPPEGLLNKRKLSISLPDISNLAETAGVWFASTPPREVNRCFDGSDAGLESESHGSGESETSSTVFSVTSETPTPSASPTPFQPPLVHTSPRLQQPASPTVSTDQESLSSSGQHSIPGQNGSISLPCSPRRMPSFESKVHPNQTPSGHLAPPPSPRKLNGKEAKVDKRDSVSEGRKENGATLSKRPSFVHQTSQDSPPVLRKKKASTFTFKGVVKRIKRISTSAKKPTAAEEGELLTRSLGSISSSKAIGLEEDEEETVQVLLRAMNVVEFWIEHHYKDFSSNHELRIMMIEFLQEITEHPMYFTSPEVFTCLRVIGRKLEEFDSDAEGDSLPVLLHKTTNQDLSYLQLMFNDAHPWVASPERVSHAPKMDLLAHKPQEVAQQLTLLQFAFYTAIDRRELLNTAWKGKHRGRDAPNVVRAIEQGNKIVMWVCTEVIQQTSEHDRVAAIEFFIRVAEECYRHNDMHCLIMVHSALSCCAVAKLKSSWPQVDRKLREKLDSLRPFCETTGRCKKMREHIKKLARVSDSKRPSCLPYLGAYLDQIWSLEMSKSTKNSQGLINFCKMESLYEIIDSILKYQSKPYGFPVNVKLIRYIYNASVKTDEELYILSSSHGEQ